MRVLVCILLAVLALPLAAQEPPEVPPLEVEVLTEEPPTVPPIDIEIPTTATEESISPVEEEAPGIASKINAAAWCVLKSREELPEAPAGEGEQGDAPQVLDDEIGCDLGIGASLIGRDFRQGRLSLVGVLGAKSLGLGGAWTFGRQGGRPLSVALGLVAPYDSSGIYSSEWAVALGATVSLFGRR